MFTFFVGAERTAITLHNILVSQSSAALDALMNGTMSEAKTGQAEMPDVDATTFVRFGQWLYTGHYDVPYCDGRSQMALEVKCETVDFSWDHGLTKVEKKRREKEMRMNNTWHDRLTQEAIDESAASPKRRSVSGGLGGKQKLWESFMPHPDLDMGPPPRKNPEAINVDWEEVLLGHARLYCFADMYGIGPLQKLCSNAVRAALVDLECEGDQVDALIRMISYVVEHTPSTSCRDTHELRAVVLNFAAIIFEVLVRHEGFREFLRTNSDTSVDLLSLLSARLC